MTDTASAPLLAVDNLSVAFGPSRVVENLMSSSVLSGCTIAIVGESGSGKSVTARTIMGLLTKRAVVSRESKIAYDGKDILKFSSRARRALRGNRMSMIFQEPMSSLNPIYTIGSQIVEAIR
ncbi:ATP-binding cassette domain-containing protein, partial [Escherichia coli]|nr:ATP-binding cassette domain-containing protein [Escherichia coli]